MFNCGRCNFAVETEEVMTTHCLENHGVNHVNNYFKRGAKSIAKKVTLEETITKLASRGHRCTKADAEPEEESVVEVEVAPSKTSKRGAKSKAKKVPGDETITKLVYV